MKYLSVFIYVTILLISFQIIAFDLQDTLVEIHDINETEHQNVLNYLEHKEPLKVDMSEREASHLADVQKLNDIVHWIILFLVIISIAIFAKTGLTWQGFRLFVIVASIIAFFPASAQEALERTAFEGDSYLFSDDSKLLELYPQQYFFDLFIYSFILAAFLGLISTYFYRRLN